ncbi:hypothetical protein V6N13_075525 [Hibiscus sabdariffa]
MPLRLAVALFCATASLFAIAGADDPYRFYSWNVTYGDIYPLGVRQTVLQAHLDRGKKLPFPDGILINGRGPGGASLNVEQGMNSPSPRMLSSVEGQSAEAPDPCKPPHNTE